MAKIFEGNLLGVGLKFGVVISRFNEFIGQKLLDGARDAFSRHGVDPGALDIAWTPGSFETPLIAQRMARSGNYHALICLGAIIKGGTPHFEYVAGEVAKGIGQVSLTANCAVTFGVLTTDSIEQAVDRAGVKAGNKGADAAASAIEMANLMDQLSSPRRSK